MAITEAFGGLALPLLIFLARICDVSIQTVRIVFVARGHKFLAPILGFFEVLIWVLAIGQIMQNLDNWLCYVAYAGGFAVGNLVGMVIEEKLAMGAVILRIMTQANASGLIEALKGRDFGVTTYAADGLTGTTNVIFSVVERKDVPVVAALIQEHNPQAFYTTEDVRSMSHGKFPRRTNGFVKVLKRWRRKSK